MDTKQMVERARLLLSPGYVVYPPIRPWAEALLAEHDARVAAERERDEWRSAAEGFKEQAEAWHGRVATLEAALRTAINMLDYFGAHVAASWAPHADLMYREQLSDLRAVLGDQEAQEGTDA